MTEKHKTYRVVVRKNNLTDEHVVGTNMSLAKAERVERGLLRKVDTNNWHVTIVEEKS